MGWGIVLAVLLLLGCLPLGVSVIYEASGFVADLMIGPVKKRLYPGRKKIKADARRKNPEESNSKTIEQPKEEKQQGGSLQDFLPLLQVAKDFLGGFRRKLRVKRLEFLLVMAGEDPCDLAINYGKAWAAAGNILPQLERFLVIRKRDVQVCCDFTADVTTVYLRADVTITVGRLLGLLVKYGIRACKEYFKIINKRKGGAIS